MTGYRTLGDIVDEFIILKGYDTRHNFQRLYNISIRGLKSLWFDVSGTPVNTYLELDENQSAHIPNGLVKVIGLWISTLSGKIPILENNKINPITSKSENTITEPINNRSIISNYGLSPDVSASYWKNGEFTGGVFSGVGGNPYTYVINYEANKFQFSSVVPKRVLCEFIQNPAMVNNKFYIHPFVEEPILNYLHWKDAEFNPQISSGEKDRLRFIFYRSKDHAKNQFNSSNMDEFRDAFRKWYSQTPT
jgi:hypothetical protein